MPAALRRAIQEEEVILGSVLAMAKKARTDMKTFFEFVMKHETTKAPLRCLPHQRVLFDFVQRYPRCVVRMPAGTSKSFSMAALTLWLLGNDRSARGALISETQAQSAKILAMVRDAIETSPELRLVFPHLAKSPRLKDPWTQTAITIDRPPGIRDPSLIAMGDSGKLPGARLSWCVVDDILSMENTSTPAALQKVHEFIDSTVLARLDPDIGRIVVTNTPWNRADVTYLLEEAGWPTIRMDVLGNIELSNCPDFDTDDITPSARPGDVYRLTAHNEKKNELGEVEDETVPLFPARYSWEQIDDLRKTHLPHRFNQLYLCLCRDEENALCKAEWIEQCKVRGLQMVSQYDGENLTVTGIDLAVGKESRHDKTALFTFELNVKTGIRRILDIEVGHWDGPTIAKKAIAKSKAYRSILRVENNAAQAYLIQFIRMFSASVPLHAHTTGRNKSHPEDGVEGVFQEFRDRKWQIPCDANGRLHTAVQHFIDDCLFYQPHQHVGDVLMACWFAREQVRSMGLAYGKPKPLRLSQLVRAR